eukprot:44427-Prymnesium_polylepis.1
MGTCGRMCGSRTLSPLQRTFHPDHTGRDNTRSQSQTDRSPSHGHQKPHHHQKQNQRNEANTVPLAPRAGHRVYMYAFTQAQPSAEKTLHLRFLSDLVIGPRRYYRIMERIMYDGIMTLLGRA